MNNCIIVTCEPPIPPLRRDIIQAFAPRDDSAYSYSNNTQAGSASSDLKDNSSIIAPNPSAAQKLFTPEEDARNENIVQAMKLLLAARERVLTLSEQRVGSFLPP